MRKVTISALAFAVLLAAAAPAGSQTRPRRVWPASAPDTYSESGPRPRAEESRAEERAAGERRGSRWRRVLFGAGLAAATYGRGRAGRSCTPSRRVIGGQPR
jgi:hypothetical protein